MLYYLHDVTMIKYPLVAAMRSIFRGQTNTKIYQIFISLKCVKNEKAAYLRYNEHRGCLEDQLSNGRCRCCLERRMKLLLHILQFGSQGLDFRQYLITFNQAITFTITIKANGYMVDQSIRNKLAFDTWVSRWVARWTIADWSGVFDSASGIGATSGIGTRVDGRWCGTKTSLNRITHTARLTSAGEAANIVRADSV